jgi:hypothetical protein
LSSSLASAWVVMCQLRHDNKAGTSGSENSARGGAITVTGLRENMNSFLLDGITNTSIGVGTYVVTPPVDSVQEFRMETGVYDARFGANAGAQVNVVTKSGTNQFHGSLIRVPTQRRSRCA